MTDRSDLEVAIDELSVGDNITDIGSDIIILSSITNSYFRLFVNSVEIPSIESIELPSFGGDPDFRTITVRIIARNINVATPDRVEISDDGIVNIKQVEPARRKIRVRRKR